MKRDREIQIQLLRHVRDGGENDLLAKLDDGVAGYNAALLIEEGLVEGDAVKDHQGMYVGAALTMLTNAGHDFLERFESSSDELDSENLHTMKIFISHSSADTAAAEALVELLRASFDLPREEIRCTSVDGYRLPAGSDTDEQLRQEVRGSAAFIGVITPTSISSTYVLFELGARWGAGLPLFPVMAGGATSAHLRGPLSGINALDMTSEAQIHQLLTDLAPIIELTLDAPEGRIAKVASLRSVASASVGLSPESLPTQPSETVEFEPSDEQYLVLKTMAGLMDRTEYTFVSISELGSIVSLSKVEFRSCIRKLKHNDLVDFDLQDDWIEFKELGEDYMVENTTRKTRA